MEPNPRNRSDRNEQSRQMQKKATTLVPVPSCIPGDPEMDSAGEASNILPGDVPTPMFDWSDLLEFTLDETLNISFPDAEPGLVSGDETGIGQSSQSDNAGRTRKRDPRLVCPNFLAGRVPCACPELDAQLAEEEEALLGKKRPRVAGVSGRRRPVQCQVPSCEVDITELKGYHKRHRVCLQCANASSVVLEGEEKRYCQQCGKFHLLPDFDEGKRSCRRKLERHNNRRRRKPNGSKASKEKEGQQIILADDDSADEDSGKEGISLSNQMEEKGTQAADENISTLCSTLVSQKFSDEININMQKQNSIIGSSPSSGGNKDSITSTCPTGRISFKLYDWNPTEFPRRLRLQILRWLASMPIELEGYIRPGCTILTAFIAMPSPMWHKLLDQPAPYLTNLIASPGNELFGKGTMLIYLNDMIFHIGRDAHSVLKIKMKDRSPRLHYIHPTCFEAGKPMEFVACGSNLLQTKFRFLVSFAGKYLAYNISISSLYCKEGNGRSSDHQLLKILIPQTDENLFGPAFVEVENQSGLSNFVPILVGDKETCVEMEILLQKLDAFPSTQEQHESLPCGVMASRQGRFSEFLLDVAWSLKLVVEQPLKPSYIQRCNNLLKFLIENDSSAVLKRVVFSLRSAIGKKSLDMISEIDMISLKRNMMTAQSMIAVEKNLYSPSSQRDDQLASAATYKEILHNMNVGSKVALLEGDAVMNVNIQTIPRTSRMRPLTRNFSILRPLAVVIAVVIFCVGACLVVLHPRRVNQIAVTIRRCLFDGS